MANRPLYIRKLHSSRLKEFGYNISSTFDESKELKEVIGLADSQMLRSIRDITGHEIDYVKLEELIRERDILRKQPSDNRNRINELQKQINDMMFIDDYMTVVIDHPTHYDYMFNNGFNINGNEYRRLSCAAGQARVSTVVFNNSKNIDDLKLRLNNGRNKNVSVAPSKFNAYFGLSSSATKVVSEPKFIVVKDFENETTFKANYVKERGYKYDDKITVKEVTQKMNRTDGMGLIKYSKALEWSKELELDYVPSQFCIRQNFIKGMLCVFPVDEFCEQKNGGNYEIETIYKDKNGNYIKADIRDYDVIISESQFKLWDSFDNVNQYIENCHENKLDWGIALYTPKKAKNILKLNYQFIQTLNLDKDDVEKLASQFVDWICGVSYDNVEYMKLFLLGINNDEDKIKSFISSSDNYWIKSLLINPELKNDKYIRGKIRDLLKKKIKNACMGDIYVDGNFQVLVSDPYGFMQHVCGLEVTGLLKKGEFYSNYWNERKIKQVDAMRSPLTYLSEHVILNLRNDKETNYWYQYCDLGIILNYHGHEVVNFGGADFDMDILATSSNLTMIKGVYKNELPVVYDAPKPEKKIFTDEDLYIADKFSFGSKIGSITNKGSNGYALLIDIEKAYGKDSLQYKILKSRLQQCCKAQSAQIDKAKIGKEVKGIPDIWVNKQPYKKDRDGNIINTKRRVQYINFYNSILLNKHPYFFRYLYRDTNKLYKDYVEKSNITCRQKFQMSLQHLEKKNQKILDQIEFIKNFYKYMPVTYNDSSMNLLCRYIESINFDISNKTKADSSIDVVNLFKKQGKEFEYDEETCDQVIAELKSFIKGKRFDKMLPDDEDETLKYNPDIIQEIKVDNEFLEDRLNNISSNTYMVVNCLIDYFYIDRPSSNKDILWNTFGKYIYNNVKVNSNIKNVMFPMPNDNGDILYLGEKYKLEEVII